MLTYKARIRTRIQSLKKANAGFSLKQLAPKIPVEYTYLSRSLKDGGSHLADDALFQLLGLLKFSEAESEIISLLKAWEVSQHPIRRKTLLRRIQALDAEWAAQANPVPLMDPILESQLLVEPYCWIIFTAMHIPRFLERPLLLLEPLGLPEERLRRVLLDLERAALIQRRTDVLHGYRLLQSNIHISKEHPMMRTHQMLLKRTLADRISKTEEDAKESFFVTFTADSASFEELQTRLKVLLKEFQKMVVDSKDHHLYQLQIDLCRWL